MTRVHVADAGLDALEHTRRKSRRASGFAMRQGAE
jgi:hypothetical protein